MIILELNMHIDQQKLESNNDQALAFAVLVVDKSRANLKDGTLVASGSTPQKAFPS